MSMRQATSESCTAGKAGRLSAFTLVEMLAVLAIIAATGAGIVLSARPITSKARLRSAGEELAGLLETVSIRAFVRRTPQVISFWPGDGRLGVTPVTDDENARTWTHHLPHGVVIRQVRMNEQVIDREGGQLLMQPSGYMQDTALCLGLKDQKLYVNWQGSSGHCRLGKLNESNDSHYKY